MSTGAAKPTYSKVQPAHFRRALALLLTGAARDDPAVEPFLVFAKDHNFCLEQMWAAYQGQTMLAATLLVPCPGRTAMMFISPTATFAEREVIGNLARVVCAALDGRKLRVVQTLLEPSQHHETKALRHAGFSQLAELLYLQRATDIRYAPLELDRSIRVVHWSNDQRQHFVRGILASYEDTLDCPGLLGLRHIDDIIEGHMAAGVFKPQMWLALHRAGEPVAIMLLNLIRRSKSAELVYFGVGPAWRKQGLGRKLLIHGISLAAKHGADDVILAVDRLNVPAVNLYRSMAFAVKARKRAMIFSPPLPSS